MAVIARGEAEAVAAQTVPARAPARFPCFDGLRALAAFSVFAFHSAVFLHRDDQTYVPYTVQMWLRNLGTFGVAVFFVISGFLLYRPFVVAVLDGRPAPALLPFWSRRVFRIFPAYWVALAAAILIVGQTSVRSLGQAMTTFALLQNYRYGYQLLGLAVAWTLVIELSFYVFLPLFARVVASLAGAFVEARARMRVQLAAVAVLAIAGVAFRAWYYFVATNAPALPGRWFAPVSAILWLPAFLDWFAFGMVMAIGSAWLAAGGRVPKVIDLLGRVPALSWLVALALYWFMVQLLLGVFTSTPPGSDGQLFVNWTLAGMAGAFFVLPAAFGPQSHGTVRRILRTRVLVILGVVSYGFYLWHVVIWNEVRSWLPSGVPMLVQVAIAFTASVLVALLSWELVERPIVRWSSGHGTSLFSSGALAAQRDDLPAERRTAGLELAVIIVLAALFVWAIGSIDLTDHEAVGTHDDFGWRGEHANIWDDFGRPNGPGIGVTATGQQWETLSGVLGISAGHAVANGAASAIVHTKARDLRAVGGGLAFRCADVQNCWQVVPVPAYATWSISKVVDGHPTYVGSIGNALTAPTTAIAVHLRGDRIIIVIDGVVRRTLRDPDLRGTVGVGLAQGTGTGAATWRSFEADR